MAKRRFSGEANDSTDKSFAAQAGGTIGDFAGDLSKFLGDTERKASEWLGQRKAMTDRLTAIRDQAARLLRQMGSLAPDMPSMPGLRRRGRPVGSKNQAVKRGPGGPRKAKRRTMSAEARARIAEAQRKRWAKVRAGK